jgi:CheY-like chemotaxis protein
MSKILIVDDNEPSRALLRAVLRAPGRQIFEASQGREALELIARETPDLVLLDIEMPELDGYGVVRALRDNSQMAAVPVVAVTANAMQGARERILAAGFDDCITKPIDATAIRRLAAGFLDAPKEGK